MLAYLVRRLLENGANSSFVNRIADEHVGLDDLVRDPVADLEALQPKRNPKIVLPSDLFGPGRRNSAGVDLSDPLVREPLIQRLKKLEARRWTAKPGQGTGEGRPIASPHDHRITVGTTFEATAAAEFPAFRARLSGLHLPGGRADLDAALGLTRDLLLPKLADEVVLITDGALTADPELVDGLGAPIELVVVGGEPVGAIGGNVGITDLSARAMPGSPDRQQLWMRIANFTPQTVAVPVVLWSDGIESDRRTVQFLPASVGIASFAKSPKPLNCLE